MILPTYMKTLTEEQEKHLNDTIKSFSQYIEQNKIPAIITCLGSSECCIGGSFQQVAALICAITCQCYDMYMKEGGMSFEDYLVSIGSGALEVYQEANRKHAPADETLH